MSDLTIEDRLAIQALVTEYAFLLDHRRWQDVAALCTDDVVLTIRGRNVVGKPGLAEWAEQRASKGSRRTQHQMSNLRLEPGPDSVTGTVSLALHVARSGSGSTDVEFVGEYVDEYVRTPAGWRFRRRRLERIDAS
jgi:ketosteroid isomerase-like protein